MSTVQANEATSINDIYLMAGCVTQPDLSDLGARFPVLTSTEFQSLLVRSSDPGFLGLDMPYADAVMLLGRLQVGGAVGQVTPAAYRHPSLSIDEALALAQPILVQHEAAEFAGYQFGPVILWREEARWWVIGAVSEQLLDEGHIPGGVSIAVDKLDGHIWTFNEIVGLN
jgi:hypothetical protein